jgi:type VI secretion system protein VasG
MSVNLKSLIGKLNDETRRAFEAAAGLCLSRTHYDVEVEHYLLKLLDSVDGDFAIIARHFSVNRSRLSADITASLDRLKSGNARTPAMSPSLVRMLTEAWTVGSLDFGASHIRSGHTVLALVTSGELSRLLKDVSGEFDRISAEELRKDFLSILEESSEEESGLPASPDGVPATAGGKTPNLDQFTVDLTERAQQGRIDPVLGRDFEVRQVVDILTRRRQNNPILVGEAGVGKTAVVEGFAQRDRRRRRAAAAAQRQPPHARPGLLQAGAGVKGEFENRLKGLIEEVKNSSPTPIILFIDEAHTMIGAGGQAGQGDAANLLKPALARGELRTIAATTWSEYKKYFEKDPALARRFQLVKVEEPSEESACDDARHRAALEKHHNVRILDDGVDRRRAALAPLPAGPPAPGQGGQRARHRLRPALARPERDARRDRGRARTLDDLEVQERVLLREQAVGADHGSGWRRSSGAATPRRASPRCTSAGSRSASSSSGSASSASGSRTWRLAGDAPQTEACRRRGAGAARRAGPLNDELETLQGENPLIPVCVDAELVGQVISGWTGIPVGKMLRDDLAHRARAGAAPRRRVIGQDHALEIISHRIRTSKAGIEDPHKPIGVFLLVGPSGVGKTETALALSTCSTAASTTSSPSTCRSSRRRTPSPR